MSRDLARSAAIRHTGSRTYRARALLQRPLAGVIPKRQDGAIFELLAARILHVASATTPTPTSNTTPAPTSAVTPTPAPGGTGGDVGTTLDMANLALQVAVAVVGVLAIILAVIGFLGWRNLAQLREANESMRAEADLARRMREELEARLGGVESEFASLVQVAYLFNEGQRAYIANEYERSSAYLEEALTIQPTNPGIRVKLARVYVNQGHNTVAESMLDSVVESTTGDTSGAWRALATAYRYDDPARAIESIKKSLAEDNLSSESWNYLGLLLRDSGRLDECRAAHEKALSLGHLDPVTLYYLSLAEFGLKRPGAEATSETAYRRAENALSTGRIKPMWAATIEASYHHSRGDTVSLAAAVARLHAMAPSPRNRRAVLQHLLFHFLATGLTRNAAVNQLLPFDRIVSREIATEVRKVLTL